MTYDLASLGWDAALATMFAIHPGAGDGDHWPGRVCRVERGVCTVLTGTGAARASLAGTVLATTAGDPAGLPGPGDWVVVRGWPDQRTTVEAVLPRRASIVRAAGTAQPGQVLAANMDTVAVVEPLDPAPDLGRIERLLALAGESGARPVVLLAKADLAADPGVAATRVAGAAPGVDVITVSGRVGDGLDLVRRLVRPGRTLAMLGPSGSGKSTLVKALAGATVMVTQAVRPGGGRGRYTSPYWVLIPVPGGGAVFDAPGLRVTSLEAEACGGGVNLSIG